MPVSAAGLRFPYQRTLLPRTKLAYVHLRNLLNDAKRDRAARVYGYVAIWMPEEFLLLYLQHGELVNATRFDGDVYAAVPIAEALGRVPAEPEFGEIAFHQAEDEQLACMYHAQVAAPEPWPLELDPADGRAVFPYLMAVTYDGMAEIALNGSMNYLVLENGVVQRAYLTDPSPDPTAKRVQRLFTAPRGPAAPRVRRWPMPTGLPVQAAPGLIQAYRELVHALVRRLAESGVDSAPVLAEHARTQLLQRYTLLSAFNADGRPAKDPVCEARLLTEAVGTWISDVLWATAGHDAVVPETLLRDLTRGRRHMFQSAGLYDALPWRIAW